VNARSAVIGCCLAGKWREVEKTGHLTGRKKRWFYPLFGFKRWRKRGSAATPPSKQVVACSTYYISLGQSKIRLLTQFSLMQFGRFESYQPRPRVTFAGTINLNPASTAPVIPGNQPVRKRKAEPQYYCMGSGLINIPPCHFQGLVSQCPPCKVRQFPTPIR
jgi:hypothetical protein